MNKFLGTLIIQNIIVSCMIIFIPFYLVFKSQNDVSSSEYVFLFLFVIAIVVISILDHFLIKDPYISFGFLRFYPFIFLLYKFNSLLKTKYKGYKVSTYQRYLTIVYLMNGHSILSKESYANFSRMLPVKADTFEDDFQEMIENPFWVALHDVSDQYGVNREELAEQGIIYNESSFAKKFFLFIALYLFVVAVVFLQIQLF